MSYAMVDIYCASYRRPPRAVTLDIDDTVDPRVKPEGMRGARPSADVAVQRAL
jgi:hypothetical protein